MRRTPFIVAVLAFPLTGAMDREPEAVRVRHPEGSVHGFLKLSTAAGAHIGNGDLLQSANGEGMKNRMIFRFTDGSYFEEAVEYTQSGVFKMREYRLIQRGPSFPYDLDAKLSSSGAYSLVTRSHDEDGEVERKSGTLELPADTYNGLPITLAKNLTQGDVVTVHIVAFTPKPRIIRLQIAPVAVQFVRFGADSARAIRYALDPKIGGIVGVMAKLVGKNPPDSHAWILTDGVPAFLRFEGPLFTGPVWRIDLTTPTWR
jgi:hypothetical protein